MIFAGLFPGRQSLRVLPFGAAVLAVAVTGCSQLAQVRIPTLFGDKHVDLRPAPLPSYRAGDTFTYVGNDKKRKIRRVVRARGDTVDWTTEEKYAFTTYRNFFLPKITWDGPSSSGRLLSALPTDLLWPLKAGNKADVTAHYKKVYKTKFGSREYAERWSCRVEDSVRITVPAGTFDTFKVRCKRYSDTNRVTRTQYWYYAPKVGHFVKRIKKYRSKPTATIELVSYRRGPAGSAGKPKGSR